MEAVPSDKPVTATEPLPRQAPGGNGPARGEVEPPSASYDHFINRAVIAFGFLGLTLGLTLHAYVQPFPWETAVLIGILAAATRPLGIPLPGKGFTSFVVGACTAAVVVLGWGAGTAVAAAAVFIGDAFLRRLPLRSAFALAGHVATACVIGGLTYSWIGGVYGPGALSVSNLWPLALILVTVPIVANATFYLQIRLSPTVPWVDPGLTLRWEIAVTSLGTALAVGVLAILSPRLPAVETTALAAFWLAFAVLAHWLVRRGVEGESLLLVQRLTRAIGARTEFLQAFEDIKRLTTALVPWHHMGIASYQPSSHEFEILTDTEPEVRSGMRFPADSGLTRIALEHGGSITDAELTAELRDEYREGSEILVPLKHGERLVGLWSVRHRDRSVYRADEARMLGHLAPQLALSIALDSLVMPVLNASDRTTRQAQMITASTQDLRIESEEAAGHARQVTDIVRELARTLSKGAAQAEEARAVAERSAGRGEATRASGQEMLETVHGVRAANEAALNQLAAAARVVEEGAEEVARLREASDTVERFRETIAQLADQSGLLALNAAIEAARAGEQGRGFGVVAHEIRALADRSGDEAEGIAEGVQLIRATLERAIERMQRIQREVLAVAEAGRRWSGDLDAIVEAAEAVAETGQSIASTASEAATRSAEMALVLAEASTEAEAGAAATDVVASASVEQKRLIDDLDRSAADLAEMADHLATAAAAVRAQARK